MRFPSERVEAWARFDTDPGHRDGAARHTIGRLDFDDAFQEWSADSTQIAFIGTTDADGSGTYVYDLATGETRFVTDGTIESWVDNDHILVS